MVYKLLFVHVSGFILMIKLSCNVIYIDILFITYIYEIMRLNIYKCLDIPFSKGKNIRTFIVKNVSKRKRLERWSGRYRRAPSSGSSCLTLPVFYNFAFGKRESRPRQTKVGTDICFFNSAFSLSIFLDYHDNLYTRITCIHL